MAPSLQILASVADKIKNFAVIYLVDIKEVRRINAVLVVVLPLLLLTRDVSIARSCSVIFSGYTSGVALPSI